MPFSLAELRHKVSAFATELQRLEYLFGLYQELSAPLVPAAKPKAGRKGKA